MGRWQPDARERLERAALDLFLERGFDETTVPDITERAGLTTRTFFRHFADKREVLFAGADRMPALASETVRTAPTDLTPAEVVRWSLPRLVAEAFAGHREQLVRHKQVVDGHEGLRERELRKMAAIVDAVAAAFVARGEDELTAAVLAETAVGVVKVSLRRWIDADDELPLADVLADSLDRLERSFS